MTEAEAQVSALQRAAAFGRLSEYHVPAPTTPSLKLFSTTTRTSPDKPFGRFHKRLPSVSDPVSEPQPPAKIVPLPEPEPIPSIRDRAAAFSDAKHAAAPVRRRSICTTPPPQTVTPAVTAVVRAMSPEPTPVKFCVVAPLPTATPAASRGIGRSFTVSGPIKASAATAAAAAVAASKPIVVPVTTPPHHHVSPVEPITKHVSFTAVAPIATPSASTDDAVTLRKQRRGSGAQARPVSMMLVPPTGSSIVDVPAARAVSPDLHRSATISVTPARLKAPPKDNMCWICHGSVYAVEQVAIDGMKFHGWCVRCKECNCKLSGTNFATVDGMLFCKPHYTQLFKLKGNYNEGFGTAQRKHDFS